MADYLQDGLAADASPNEGAVLLHLRSALNLCDPLERRRRRADEWVTQLPRQGEAKVFKLVLADELADEARAVTEAKSDGQRVGRSSGSDSGTVLAQFSPEKRNEHYSEVRERDRIEEDLRVGA